MAEGRRDQQLEGFPRLLRGTHPSPFAKSRMEVVRGRGCGRKPGSSTQVHAFDPQGRYSDFLEKWRLNLIKQVMYEITELRCWSGSCRICPSGTGTRPSDENTSFEKFNRIKPTLNISGWYEVWQGARRTPGESRDFPRRAYPFPFLFRISLRVVLLKKLNFFIRLQNK